MADALKDVLVNSRGGLYTNEDTLTLASTLPGSAIRMLNMEVGQFGGYRRINGYADYDSSFGSVTGSGPVMGIWILNGTPYAVRRNLKDNTGSLGSDPFVVTSGSPTITVTHSSHGLSTGDRVTFAGSSAVGGVTPNAVEMVVTVVNANSYTVVFTSNASSGATGGGSSVTFTANNGTQTLGSNPFSISNTSSTITVAHTSHGLVVGNFVTFSGSASVGNITPNSVEMKVTTVPDANSYTVEFTSAATSTVSGGGGTSVTANYSKFYTIWKYNTGGWTTVSSNRSSVGVTKVRHSMSAYGSTEDVIITDGLNFPATFNGTTVVTHAAGVTTNSSGAKFSTDFKNHKFYGGFPSSNNGGNKILFSQPSDPDAYGSTSGTLEFGADVVGMAAFRDSLFVFGERQIKKVTGNNKTDFAVSDVTANVGCIATDSIIEIGGDILFLASDGIRPIQGTANIGDVELETISKPIQQLLQDLPNTHNLDNMSSVVINNKSQFRYFFPSETTATPDTEGVIGGLRFANRRVGWEFGQLLGIRAFVSTSGLINKVETVLHGDLNGEIYQQESGNTFDTADVTAVYATPFLYFDSTEKRKIYQHVSLFTRPEGSSSLNLGIAYNWDDNNTPDPTTYALTTAGALSRYTTTSSEYDNVAFTFDGSSSPVLETNLQGSGKSISLVITSTGTQAPYSIAGFSITYQDAGYR